MTDEASTPIVGQKGKQYGLVIKNTAPQKPKKLAPSIFGNDDDDDSQSVNSMLAKQNVTQRSLKKVIQRN
jgi:hypothetical protein